MIFFNLMTCLLDNVLMFYGEIKINVDNPCK